MQHFYLPRRPCDPGEVSSGQQRENTLVNKHWMLSHWNHTFPHKQCKTSWTTCRARKHPLTPWLFHGILIRPVLTEWESKITQINLRFQNNLKRHWSWHLFVWKTVLQQEVGCKVHTNTENKRNLLTQTKLTDAHI